MTTSGQYRHDFDRAVSYARSFGFTVPAIAKTSPPMLDTAIKDALWGIVERNFRADELAGACLHVTYNVREAVERLLQVPAHVTVGAVTVGKNEGFAFGDDHVRRWLHSGVSTPMRDIHAWMTLPSMEVIDFTFMFTYVKALKLHGKMHPGPIMLQPGEMVGLSYRPILVAENFAERVGAISGIEIFPLR